jgi:hypothetical protein
VYKSLFIYWQCTSFEPDDDDESFLSQFFLYICCPQHIRLFCFFSASMNCIRFRNTAWEASRRTCPEAKFVWKANHLNIFFCSIFLQFAISYGQRDHLTARNRVLYLFVRVSITDRSRNNFSFIYSELLLSNILENLLQIRSIIPSAYRQQLAE